MPLKVSDVLGGEVIHRPTVINTGWGSDTDGDKYLRLPTYQISAADMLPLFLIWHFVVYVSDALRCLLSLALFFLYISVSLSLYLSFFRVSMPSARLRCGGGVRLLSGCRPGAHHRKHDAWLWGEVGRALQRGNAAGSRWSMQGRSCSYTPPPCSVSLANFLSLGKEDGRGRTSIFVYQLWVTS